MVLENIKIDWIERRPYISFLFGFFYTLIGYIVAIIFFPNSVSFAMLFLATLLIVPSLMKLLEIEEKRESRYGLRYFIKEHKDVIEAYIFLFIGVFAGYVALGYLAGKTDFTSVFQFQLDFLKNQQGLNTQLIDEFFTKPVQPQIENVAGVLAGNLKVMLICFVLSIFYGAGAIFLIVMNASIFASFIVFVARYITERLGHTLLIIGIFSLHMVPEVSGFLLAAIAGGVLSKAMMQEKLRSERFMNVFKDSLMLLLISCALITAAAFIEVYVTTYLFHRFV